MQLVWSTVGVGEVQVDGTVYCVVACRIGISEVSEVGLVGDVGAIGVICAVAEVGGVRVVDQGCIVAVEAVSVR